MTFIVVASLAQSSIFTIGLSNLILKRDISCIQICISAKMSSHFGAAKQVINYFALLASNNLPKTNSVVQLQNAIMNNPVVRMNMEISISKSQETLKGLSIGEIMALINASITQPPSFTKYPLLGAPLNSIFCQFMQTENGRSFFSNQTINLHLKNVLDTYSQMLKSQSSLKYLNDREPDGWFSASARQVINYDEVICDQKLPYFGFSNWNDFFTRRLKPHSRPIYGEGTSSSNKTIIHSCQSYPLQDPRMPVHQIQRSSSFWLKEVNYSLADMFGANQPGSQTYAKLFEHGSLYQGFLSVFCYHRWHSPVDGQIIDQYLIQGTYFLDQSQFISKTLDSPYESQGFLTSVATRRVIVIRADNEDIGYIGLIYVGIADISSCISVVSKGQKVKKGQELGRFQIGGSSVAVLFSKNSKLRFCQSLYDQKGAKLQKVNSLLAYLA